MVLGRPLARGPNCLPTELFLWPPAMCLHLCSASLPLGAFSRVVGGPVRSFIGSFMCLTNACSPGHLGQGLGVLWRTGQTRYPFCGLPGHLALRKPLTSSVTPSIMIPSLSEGRGWVLTAPEASSSFRPVISECLLPDKLLPSNPANISHLSLCSKMVNGLDPG